MVNALNPGQLKILQLVQVGSKNKKREITPFYDPRDKDFLLRQKDSTDRAELSNVAPVSHLPIWSEIGRGCSFSSLTADHGFNGEWI